ncbi:unnamed protein product [Callosobruchus maculatus]|uniref:Uncharacterized protein n=1 Tax=Callosobruchus maculatus TaxID=64391 RepID=A0A653CGR0_CALMS|nr:unnamed protein product [Callosobruchus maculatus]
MARWCPGVAKRRAMRRIRREQKMSQPQESDEDGGSSSKTSSDVNIPNPDSGPRDSIVSDILTAYTEESYDVQTVTVHLRRSSAVLQMGESLDFSGCFLFFLHFIEHYRIRGPGSRRQDLWEGHRLLQ